MVAVGRARAGGAPDARVGQCIGRKGTAGTQWWVPAAKNGARTPDPPQRDGEKKEIPKGKKLKFRRQLAVGGRRVTASGTARGRRPRCGTSGGGRYPGRAAANVFWQADRAGHAPPRLLEAGWRRRGSGRTAT